MIQDITSNGYRFLVNDEGYIEAFKAGERESLSSLNPDFISNNKVKTQKEFEIEVSYILHEHLNAY